MTGNNDLLITAAFNGHTEIAKMLIDSCTDVYAKDKNGRTALDWAKARRLTTLMQDKSLGNPSCLALSKTRCN